MANDSGKIAQIEQAIADLLGAITLNSDTVFRTSKPYAFQVVSAEDWRKYSPFAFVHYQGCQQSTFEGNHDLNQPFMFEIIVGTEISNSKLGARVGIGTDASKYQLGISRLRDLVITCLQRTHPSVTGVDYFDFISDDIVWSTPTQCAIKMLFRIDFVSTYN